MAKLEDWEYELMKDFFYNMQIRMEMGKKQYGMDYLVKDNVKEMEDELFDIACYALLQWIKLRKLNETKKE